MDKDIIKKPWVWFWIQREFYFENWKEGKQNKALHEAAIKKHTL
jgi:hypothetical protein